jgi:hypothetical protein
VATLVREVPLDEIVGIIVTLAEALTVWAGAPQEEMLRQWAAATLDPARMRWCNEVELTVRELKEFFQLSERLKPLPPLPDISGTWFEYVKAARSEVSKLDWLFEMPNTKAWLELVGILRDNEPRFLRQIGFPTEYEGLITQICDAAEEYVNAERKLASAGSYESPISTLEAVDDICSLLAVASPSNKARTVSIRQAVKRKIGRYHQKLDSLASVLKSAIIKSETDTDKISIEKMFRDL